MFEQGLLDPNGKRLMLEQGEIERRYGLDSTALARLEKSRLLRREPRNESVFYEISHDRLAEAIFRQRQTKLPRWVGRALVGSAVAVMLAVGVAVSVIYERRQTEAALHQSDKARQQTQKAYGCCWATPSCRASSRQARPMR